MWRQVSFSDDCQLVASASAQTTVIIAREKMLDQECADFIAREASSEARAHYILALRDSGINYAIYRDVACDQYQLPAYSFVQDDELLRVDQLTDQRFCTSFVMDFGHN